MALSVSGQVRATIGKAQLLMTQRFKQFSGLVDNCEFGTGLKPTTCDDLQGFWDMIYFQVSTTRTPRTLYLQCIRRYLVCAVSIGNVHCDK